ncbi:hypothetical protein NMY22_g6129 [Coprinellus aureogranulatus]|nr:hypothetical protein NMY22_g6129 [Coprinellus aureogranulatus]
MRRPPKGFAKKKGPSDGTATPQGPSLAEQLSYAHKPRPFKNPYYCKNVNRRAKNLKTVLTQEREKDRLRREALRKAKAERAANGMDVDDEEDEEELNYLSIEAPPSLLPQRHYCDITGLEAPYTDPATGLRYHDKSVYALIQGLERALVPLPKTKRSLLVKHEEETLRLEHRVRAATATQASVTQRFQAGIDEEGQNIRTVERCAIVVRYAGRNPRAEKDRRGERKKKKGSGIAVSSIRLRPAFKRVPAQVSPHPFGSSRAWVAYDYTAKC